MSLYRQETLHKQLSDLFAPLIQSMGLTFWGLQVPSAPRGTLRVYIDSPDGVSIEQCAETSRHLSNILDAEDPLPGSYTLEVSSPGLERPFFTLEQVLEYTDRTVSLKTRSPVEGKRKWKGRVLSGHENRLHLQTEQGPQAFSWEQIQVIHLVFE